MPVDAGPVHGAGEFGAESPGGYAFEAFYQGRHRGFRRGLDEQVHVVGLSAEFPQLGGEVCAYFRRDGLAGAEHRVVKYTAPVVSHEDQVDVERGDNVSAMAVVIGDCRRPVAGSGVVLVRYRYRMYPTARQARMLARTFGCARVVFNDSIRLRNAARERGEYLSDSEVQARVITLAKRAPGREWLSEVASVALVQASQDARRAYRNWLDSMSGARRGGKVGHPRFRRQSARQAVRLTRNGFSTRGNGRVYLAKIGEVTVRWSRELPSEPSSVTVIREPDGRYYLSFVVEREAQPLPPAGRELGIDLGLDRLVVTSDGEIAANPRFWRKRLRRLAYLQRAASRKQKGSANRRKANKRVAVQHRKVRDARLDHAHKTALRLIRENQAVYAEDLAVSGLARTRLATSVHDAGWSQLLRLLAGKAGHYDRTLHRIGRFVPSSQTCSQCGRLDGPKPLSVRRWECPCGARHDRDVNAARNILAAGQAERLNARGAPVRPPKEAAA
jgi:putative transposase